MKNKKRKSILLIIIIILFVGVITIYNNYNNDIYVDKDDNLSNSGLSLMVETKAGSGEYTISTSDEWPTNGYEFNAEKSACENGGTLSWDEENQSVVMTSKSSDKCYAYFDVVPPDVTIAVNNLPTTYGKLGNINCSKSDAIYNQKYNRIEISNINAKYDNCTLNYIDNTSKVNFADYVMELVGTTQGAGEVVKETTNNIPNYTSTVDISKDSYTSQSVFSSTSKSSTSGTTVSGVYTFANNTWTSVPSAMTSGTYYHFRFKPSEDGYYQMCYNLSKGNIDNRVYVYANEIQKYFGLSSYLMASSTKESSGCIELDYVTSEEYIMVVQRAYTTISTLSFDIKKVNDVQESVDAGIRYEGRNPNNYVWFNNEYWRIIGVFDDTTHGQADKNMVKIIRDEAINGLVWDKAGNNDWTTSSLNKLLNGAYYNAQDGTSSGYCYGYGTRVTTNCDYTQKGIKPEYRKMISKSVWHLGGFFNTSTTAHAFYVYERGTKVYSENSTIATGYIGLMYPSDYGYGVLSSSCARTTNLVSYGSTKCAGQSWLYGKGFEWTLTVSSDDQKIFFIGYQGGVSSNIIAHNSFSSRPVLYLDALVYKVGGVGTLNDPYIIGM